jgi:hypothetical protein
MALYLRAIFGLLFCVLALAGAGAAVSYFLPANFRRFERTAFTLLGGLGLLSTVLFLVGQFSFTRVTIIVIVGAFAALGAFLSFKRLTASNPSPGAKKPPLLPALIVAAVLAFTAIAGLAEITGDWGNDAVSYHLLGPKVWLRDALIRPVLADTHTAFPQIPETFFAALWCVGGSRAPNFSSFFTLGLLLLVAASLAVRLGLSDAQAWWVAAIVATMPAVWEGAYECFVDAIFAAFVLAAVRIGLDAKNLRAWLALGIFSGFAMGTKYTGLLAVPVVLVCVLVYELKQSARNQLPQLAANIIAAAATACVLAAPYYARNWLFLGCPIFPPPPGYAAYCSPKFLPADAIAAFHAYIRQRGAGLGRSFWSFLLLPFNLTFHTSNFHGAGGIGLCPLALGPIGILYARKKRCTLPLLLLILLLTALWFLTQQESRFLIHVYVLAALFAVLGWSAIATSGSKFSKQLLAAVVFLSVSYGSLMILRGGFPDVRAVFSPRFVAARRASSIPFVAAFDFANREVSIKKLLILDRSVPPYYSDKPFLKPIGQWGERTLPGSPDAQQALASALNHQLDATHILDVSSTYSGFQVPPNTPGLILVFEDKNQRLYRVN